MKLAVYGGTEIRVSLPVLLIFPAAVLFSCMDAVIVMFLSLFVHELSHSLMAHRLGYGIASVEIHPFGFIAKLRRSVASPSEAAAIAAIGPVTSLLLAFCSAGLLLFTNAALPEGVALRSGPLYEFSFFNLTLGAFNLLPVLPLDGGRLALALVELGGTAHRRGGAKRLLATLGVITGLIIAGSGAFLAIQAHKNGEAPPLGSISFIITGSFIVLSAAGLRNEPTESAKSKLDRASRLRRGGSVRVFSVAMNARSTVREALMSVSGGGYGLVFVTDDALCLIGTLDEGALMNAAVTGHSDMPLGTLLSEKRISAGS